MDLRGAKVLRVERVEHPATARPSRRILHVINSLGGGGAERSLAELLPFYATAGFHSEILCLKKPYAGTHGKIEREAVEVRNAAGTGFWSWVRETREIIRRQDVDLVHTALFEADLVGRLGAWRSGIPVLTSLVNTSYEPVRLSDPNVTRSGLMLSRAIDGWTARHLTTHFHAITHAVKDAAVRDLDLPPEKIMVIERGRDPKRLGTVSEMRRRRIRKDFGIRDDEEVIVHVGRQEFQKGQRFLLEAMGRLAPLRPRLRLLVVGREGHATAELRRIYGDLGLGERVRFLGHCDDVPQILAASDLFVFPSLYEGQGGALIEAMGLGLPVVASDIPAVREVVEDGRSASLVPRGQAEELAAAINELLDSPRRARAYGRQGHRIFMQRFTLERSAARMIDLYHGIIDRSRRQLGRTGSR